ncbi:related to Golgi apparatus membrane protein tvp38 [Rhynchosporium agropyri]|uniref:Golgi apparatus membrane protein TVP38 n=1 Tax=Rhynchosporium agropyri TaxID=914238 RepID=A0A1E1K8P6_9HELO|nr:related to Golgi apparatus membrane protein tvp38 [Rhynchosporium agropyri]
MPADYQSTAKALALPISPISSPSAERQSVRPPWSRRISSARHRSHSSPYSLPRRDQSLQAKVISSASKVQRKVFKTFLALSFVQRVAAVTALVVLNVALILFMVYNERIFGYLAPAAKKWHDVQGGWTILWLLTFTSSFPPLIGYSTTITIAGFVYGFPNGWYIVATATVAGSTASFLASRTVLSKYVHKIVGQDKRFEALALTLKHDGIKILCMIRLCPLPYSLSNAAISTFPTVHPASFALATAITSPKLLIHVFIGSRLASIAENGGKMDGKTKAINYASIAFGAILGATVGFVIYQRTMARAKQLENEALEAGAIEEGLVVGNSRSSYSDLDLAEDTDSAALMGDDDISLWENDGERNGVYRDELTDDEDVFASGDIEDEPRRIRPKV